MSEYNLYYSDNVLNLKGLIMTVENPNASVQNEQLDPTDAGIDNKEEKKSIQAEKKEKDKPISPEKDGSLPEAKSDSEKESRVIEPESSIKPDKAVKEKAESSKPGKTVSNISTEDSAGDANEDITEEEPSESIVELNVATEPAEDLPEVDYSQRSRADLVETLELLVENRPPNEIREDVDKIKVLFYKKYKAEVDEIKTRFISEGGSEEDFTPPRDEHESIMKRLLANYRGKKNEHSKQFEIEKQENLKKKYEIIDKIKDLVNREESINKTFQEFRDLQNEWYSLGAVPQSSLKNLWETYNHNVEIFYDYIKINKELRDLDFKKNYELKVTLSVIRPRSFLKTKAR